MQYLFKFVFLLSKNNVKAIWVEVIYFEFLCFENEFFWQERYFQFLNL